MTDDRTPEERAAVDQAAVQAVQAVMASFALELTGRPLSAAQRALQRRAEDLASHFVRQDRKRGNR
jgi:hypothetical protein